MTNGDLTWRILLRARPEPDVILRWIDKIGIRGLRVAGSPSVFLATGEGIVEFEHIETAVQYMCANGGLMSMTGASPDDQLAVSVHLARGTLELEMAAMGESPEFDEIHIDIAKSAVSKRAVAWTTFDSCALAIADGADGVFAWCISESSIEAALPLRVHEYVSQNKIPRFRPVAAAAPAASVLGDQLRANATQIGLEPIEQVAGWALYRSHTAFGAGE